MTVINCKNSYLDMFTGSSECSKKSMALQEAIELRKFEVDLYWRRASYFWTLTAAVFAGYFLLESSSSPTIFSSKYIVSCIGLVFSITWYLVNRGSKYWLANWDQHVNFLEDDVIGPLYKTRAIRGKQNLLNFSGDFPFSVTKANQILSLFVVVVWLFLVCSELGNLDFSSASNDLIPCVTISLVSALFIMYLLLHARTSKPRIVVNLD